jgi:chromosome segregation ATPase
MNDDIETLRRLGRALMAGETGSQKFYAALGRIEAELTRLRVSYGTLTGPEVVAGLTVRLSDAMAEVERLREELRDRRDFEIPALQARATTAEAEVERLQADAAYGRTAMDNYGKVQQERDAALREVERLRERLSERTLERDALVLERKEAEAEVVWLRAENERLNADWKEAVESGHYHP